MKKPTPITLVRCQMTCFAAPTQIECETTDGRFAYLRHRSGRGGVGIGTTMDEAVDDWPNTFRFHRDAYGMEIAEFAAMLPEWITIESEA